MKNNTYHLFFRNLSNQLKINIVTALKEKDFSVNQLSRTLHVEQSKLSHALASLKECNIVSVTPSGKERIYSLNKETILPILELIDKHSQLNCHGKCKLCLKH